jgi:hypothetical protein
MVAAGVFISLRPPDFWVNLIEQWFKELTDKR